MRLTDKIKHRLYWKSRDLAFASGIASPVKKQQGTCIGVYHNVTPRGNSNYNSRFLSEAEFEKQLVLLKKNCRVLSLKQLMNGGYGKTEFCIALTFDDGLANNLYSVLPLLEKHEIPATFFVTSAPENGTGILWPDFLDLASFAFSGDLRIGSQKFVKKGRRYYSASNGKSLSQICIEQGPEFCSEMIEAFPAIAADFKKENENEACWRLLNREEIARLAASPFVTIGSHGQTHSSLVHLSPAQAEAELKHSKQWLEAVVSYEIDTFAYPFGHYNKELIEIAKRCGYRHQLIVDYNTPADEKLPGIYKRVGNNYKLSAASQLHAFNRGKY